MGRRAKANLNNYRKSEFYCVPCGRDFRHRSQFRRHLEKTVLHNPDGARTYPCPQCPRLFGHKDAANKHIIRHNREIEICALPLDDKLSWTCEESFTQLVRLKNHMKDHLTHNSGRWLLDAYEERLQTLKEEYGTKRVTRDKEQAKVSDGSAPPGSPLPSTPIGSTLTPTVHVHDAATMQHLGSQSIPTKRNPDEACTGKSKPSEARRPRARPTGHDFTYASRSTSSGRAYDFLNFGASPSTTELVNANEMVSKSPPAPNDDIAQPLSLPSYSVAQAQYWPNVYTAQVPSLPNAYTAQAQMLPNVHMTQAQFLPNTYMGPVLSLPNSGTPTEVPSLPDPRITQPSYSPNSYLPQHSLLSNSCYDETTLFQDPALQSSYMAVGALNVFTKFQNHQTKSFLDNPSSRFQTQPAENQYFPGLNVAQSVTCMPNNHTVGPHYLSASNPPVFIPPYQTSWPNL